MTTLVTSTSGGTVDTRAAAPTSFPPTHVRVKVPAILTAPPSNRDTTFEHLCAWTLVKAGFRCTIAIGSSDAVTIPRSEFVLHFTRPLPLATIIHALNELASHRRSTAIILRMREPQSQHYREHLRITDENCVAGIHRGFSHHSSSPESAPFVGVIWRRECAVLPTHPVVGPTWRSLRVVRRAKALSIIACTLPEATIAAEPRSTLISELPPPTLRALAAELQFEPIGDLLFVHPDAQIDPHAILRGPLFIDSTAIIGPSDIHLGAAWISGGDGSLTIPASTHHHAGENATPYFVGPRTRNHPIYARFKRLFDICFALMVLTVTSPICIVVALLVKMYDRGPIFFTHRREGIHGKPFACMKFRTMVRDAEALKAKLRQVSQVDGPQFKMANDPRITPIGRFLRKSNIDELPQFINVLKGEMSIVGPRPSPFEENQLCPPWREARLSVVPGITGLWQISRSRNRGAADFQEWIFFDTQYVERRSFWLDMKIVLLTIKELFGKGQ